MAVDDLWFSAKREYGPDGRKLPAVPTSRHGRGKRWRVRYVDDTGRQVTRSFDRKPDAEQFDASVRSDISQGRYIDPSAGRITVRDFAEQWRAQQLHRGSTSEMVERALRLHVLPRIGDLQIGAVRQSHLRALVRDRAAVLAASTVHLLFGYVASMFRAAVADRLISVSPCTGVRLPTIEREDRFIPTPQQVHALATALPDRYRAAVFLAAGCGLRPSEVLGLELTHVNFLRRTVSVQQQTTYRSGDGAYLGPVKTKTSRRTVELPDVVSRELAKHLERTPVSPCEVRDETDHRATRMREASLLFARPNGSPMLRRDWSDVWRAAVAAVEGVPTGFGLHGLRHYFATLLIHAGASVKTVQLALGHSTPTITLNTYTHEWPDALDRTRTLVDDALGALPSGPAAVGV